MSRHALSRGARHGFRRAAQALLPRSLIVWRGPAERRRVALTFDDGPTELTAFYLDALAMAGARATFFVLGELCERRPGDVERMAREGHEIASHGYTHTAFTDLDDSALRGDLRRTQVLLPATSGRRMVRPPWGTISARSLLSCALEGLVTVMWSRDSDDCRSHRSADLVHRVSSPALAPGDIVLMHEGQEWTLRALPDVVAAARDAGHELVTVSELLGEPDPAGRKGLAS